MKRYLLLLIVALVIWACENSTEPVATNVTIKGTVTNCTEYGKNDGKIEIEAEGGTQPYTYVWSTGSTEKNLSGQKAGSYTINVTDQKGNKASKEFSISQPGKTALKVTPVVTNCSKYNGTDGKIILNIIGGVKPFTFKWSNGATTQDVTNLPAGNYTVEVKDAENELRTEQVVVTQPVPEPIVITAQIQNAYGNNKDGIVFLNVAGGVAPYKYKWPDGSTEEKRKDLAAGDYSIQVTDNLGTIKTESVKVGKFETGTVTDIDGNVYKTLKIGEQWWMIENLRVKRDPKGNPIESYVYGNDEANAAKYGRLYNWNTAMDSSTTEGAQGIAPDGWHIPTEAEWLELINKFGGLTSAGAKLKTMDDLFWSNPNSGATNESGFCSLGAGEKAGAHENYRFQFQKQFSVTWSSKQINAQYARYYIMHFDKTIVTVYDFFKDYGYSVRCIKNK